MGWGSNQVTSLLIVTGAGAIPPAGGVYVYASNGLLVASIASQTGTGPLGGSIQPFIAAYNAVPGAGPGAGLYTVMQGDRFRLGSTNPNTRVVTHIPELIFSDALSDAAIPILTIHGPDATAGGTQVAQVQIFGGNKAGTSTAQVFLSSPATSPISTAAVEARPNLAITPFAAGNALIVFIPGDTFNRYQVSESGKQQWGSGAAAPDTDLFRSAVGTLKTDNALVVANGFTVSAAGENITGGSIIDTLEVTGATDLDGSLDVALGTVLNGTLTTQASRLNNDPASPAATASLTQVMMGLGSSWTLTPHSSGNVLVMVTGTATTNTAIVTVKWGGRFGTGTAPVNGAADTGTHWGPANDPSTRPPVAAVGVPFALNAVLALTAGTTYWFDLAVSTSNAADTAAVQNLAFTAIETP